MQFIILQEYHYSIFKFIFIIILSAFHMISELDYEIIQLFDLTFISSQLLYFNLLHLILLYLLYFDLFERYQQRILSCLIINFNCYLFDCLIFNLLLHCFFTLYWCMDDIIIFNNFIYYFIMFYLLEVGEFYYLFKYIFYCLMLTFENAIQNIKYFNYEIRLLNDLKFFEQSYSINDQFLNKLKILHDLNIIFNSNL